MATRVLERRGSRDFDSGHGGGTGQILFYVFGADDENDALAAALADPIVADDINGYLIDSWKVSEASEDLYLVDISYKRGIPNTASETAGTTPGSAREAPPGQDHAAPLPRDMAFTMGGETKKIFQSIETLERIAKPGDTAPDFGQLINYNPKTRTADGVDIIAGTSDFTITKRFRQLTIGWFRFQLDMVATVNEEPFLGCDKGELIYKGADGQYSDADKTKDSNPAPWTVTGRFGYSRNRANVPVDSPDPDFADLKYALIRGWEYPWTFYRQVEWDVVINGVPGKILVDRPLYCFLERVYQYPREAMGTPEGETPPTFHDLGFD